MQDEEGGVVACLYEVIDTLTLYFHLNAVKGRPR